MTARWGTGGAIVSVSCSPEEKVAWDAAVDILGYRSMSAMVRAVMHKYLSAEFRHVDSETTERE